MVNPSKNTKRNRQLISHCIFDKMDKNSAFRFLNLNGSHMKKTTYYNLLRSVKIEISFFIIPIVNEIPQVKHLKILLDSILSSLRKESYPSTIKSFKKYLKLTHILLSIEIEYHMIKRNEILKRVGDFLDKKLPPKPDITNQQKTPIKVENISNQKETNIFKKLKYKPR